MTNPSYTASIKIELLNMAIPGLLSLSSHLKAGAKDAEAYQARLLALSKSAVAAGAVAMAGFAGLKMLQAPIEEAKRYQTELTKIASLGLGPGITAHADQFARSANIIGNSATQMAEQYGDALAIFKNTREADFVAPIMAKLNFANHALYGEGGASRTSAMYGLLKAIEYRGGTKSEADFKAQAEDAAKIVNASRGRVDGRQLLQVMQTGGILAKQMSNSAFYLKSEPLIQEMGGFRFGTGLNAIYGNLGQGRGSVLSQQELFRLGLLDHSKVQFNKLGKLKRALPGAFVGMDALVNGGIQGLLSEVLLPAMAKKGITSDKGILNELGMLASNSRGAALLAAAYQQREKLAVQSAANLKAMGLDATVNAAGQTAEGQYLDLLAKESTLKTQIGTVILPAYIKGLEMVRDVLSSVINFANQHSTAFKAVVGGFAVLSSAMAVGGSLVFAKTAFDIVRIISAMGSMLPLLSATATGLPVVGAGFAGLSAMLTGPLGLALAAGAAAAAIGGLIYALNAHSNGQKDSSKKGQDIGLHRGNNPLTWVQDTWGRGGHLGHWIGKGSGAANSMHLGANGRRYTTPLAGMQINPEYMADRPLVNVSVIPPKQHVIHATIPVHVGNKHVVTHVVKVMARDAGRPNTGQSDFNSAMAMPNPASVR